MDFGELVVDSNSTLAQEQSIVSLKGVLRAKLDEA